MMTLTARRLGAMVAVLLLLTPAMATAAGQRTYHHAAATVQTVAYHLSLLTSGAVATAAVEGRVSGSLDSSGVLTATLTTTNGMTGTVTGTLSSQMPVSLTLTLSRTTLTLAGRAGRAGMAGGQAATTEGPAGAWLLVPEPVSHTYTFDARVATGRFRGQNLGGRLVIAAERGPAANFDGTLTLDDGTVLVATGTLAYGNMQLAVTVPGMGHLLAEAPMVQSHTLLGDLYNLYVGAFAGPGTGDRGTWTAAQEG